MSLFPLDYKISTDGENFNSYTHNFFLDVDEHDEELIFKDFLCDKMPYFKSLPEDLTLNVIRKIEEYTLLKENWDGFNSVPLTNNVAEKAKIFIENMDVDYFKNFEYNISPSPYSTLIIDWYNGENEFSLEIGKDSIGYYCDGQKLIKEANKIDITTIDKLKHAVNQVEKDLEQTL